MYFSDNHIKNRSHLQAFCSSMAILELRVSPIIRIKPAESLYGSHAMAKTSLEMLAEVPQIEKRTFWRLRDSRKSKRERFGACGSSANQKENALALAGLPQIKKRTLWRLRDSRKSKRERFGVCGTPANQKKNVLALAEVPQIKKRTLWRLRKFRKHSQKHFGRYSALSKPFFRD